jgi:hypothetical protein
MTTRTEPARNVPAFFAPAGASAKYISHARKRLDEWGLKSAPIVAVTGLARGVHGAIPSVDAEPVPSAVPIDPCPLACGEKAEPCSHGHYGESERRLP